MKKSAFYIILLLFLFSCLRDYEKYPKIKEPHQLLKKIYRLDISKDYSSLKYYIYNVKYRNNKLKFNSLDEMIDGIKKQKISGHFGYGRLGIFYHAQFVRDPCFVKRGDDNLIDKYLVKTKILENNKELQKIYKEKKENFIFYENDITSLVFVELNSEIKLLLSYNLWIVPYEPRIDFSKMSWWEEKE